MAAVSRVISTLYSASSIDQVIHIGLLVFSAFSHDFEMRSQTNSSTRDYITFDRLCNSTLSVQFCLKANCAVLIQKPRCCIAFQLHARNVHWMGDYSPRGLGDVSHVPSGVQGRSPGRESTGERNPQMNRFADIVYGF